MVLAIFGAKFQRVLEVLVWAGVLGTALLLIRALDAGEGRETAAAAAVVERNEALQARWRAWERDPTSNVSLGMRLNPPVDAKRGRAYVRWVLTLSRQRTMPVAFAPERMGLLIREWYKDAHFDELSLGELEVLARANMPPWLGDPPLVPPLPSTAIALIPSIEQEVARRCRRPCPPLDGGDRERLSAQAVQGLERSSDVDVAIAVSLLLRARVSSVLLEELMASSSSDQVKTAAWLILMRQSDPLSSLKRIREALLGADRGLRLVGVLEALRRLEPALLPILDRLADTPDPLGTHILARYAGETIRAIPGH